MIFKHYYYLHTLKENGMEIEIKEYIKGANEAEGLTVIIDVFRAMSVACYAFDNGVRRVIDVSTPDEAFKLKDKLQSETILVGENDEKKIPGFDYGNSPTEILTGNLRGKTMIHTTTAGTKGILNAAKATEILGAALVNASATARYIVAAKPEKVTLVAMGYRARERADEDILCANHIRDLIMGKENDISEEIKMLINGSGKRFFYPSNLDFSPPTDFFLCTDPDRFNFILKAINTPAGYAELVKIDFTS